MHLLPRRAAAVLISVGLLAGCTPPQRATTGTPAPGFPEANATATPAEPTPERTQPECAVPCRARPRTIGRFRKTLAPEASGIAAGVRNTDVLYILDDGPGTSALLVVSADDGRAIGQLQIAGLDGTDTEGLAVGPCGEEGPSTCVFIGDIGDNLAVRDTVTVTRVVEPDLSAGVPDAPAAADTATLRYPDGAHDSEALLVGAGGSITVITKDPGKGGRGAARLYTAARFADATLLRGRRLRLPSPAFPLAAAMVGNVVTGADSTSGRVVVRTYDTLYEFIAPSDGTPLRHFPSWRLREIAAPGEGQGEAVAYAADGCGLFTVSEGSGAVTSIPCR